MLLSVSSFFLVVLSGLVPTLPSFVIQSFTSLVDYHLISPFHITHINAVMSYVACTSHGPTFEVPIVEQNAERSLRPVIIKYRKVLGKRGWMLRRVGHQLEGWVEGRRRPPSESPGVKVFARMWRSVGERVKMSK